MKTFVQSVAVLCLILSQDLCTAAPRRDVAPLEIQTGPLNIAVVAPQTPLVSLQCCVTDATVNTSRVQWWEYGTRSKGNLITDGNVLLPAHPNYNRYILGTDGKCYVLTINPVNLNDGTKYMCMDLYADSPAIVQRGSQLIVIAENPLCSSQVGSNDAVEGTEYSMSCSLTFGASYPIAPVMTWTGPPTFIAEDVTSNTTVLSGVAFIANRTMEGRTFGMRVEITSRGLGGTDMATNIPTWTYTWTSAQLRVKWAPVNMVVSPPGLDYAIDTLLTCVTDANPAANYYWVAVEGPVIGTRWNSSTIQLTSNMGGPNSLLCHADNVINGVQRNLERIFLITVEYFNACASNPCQNGATCNRNGNGYVCVCIPGFTGQNCQTLIDNCASLPCVNGGTCYNSVNSYTCVCPPGYTGTNCQIPP